MGSHINRLYTGTHGGESMADSLSADLDGIQGFADRLTGLKAQLDAYAVVVMTVAGGAPDVTEGAMTFTTAENQARSVIDTYLQALQSMAEQSVATIKAQDAAMEKHLHRMYD